MLTPLTPSAAKELGRVLSLVQTTHRPRLTFREVKQRAGISSQYAHNIVVGAKGRSTRPWMASEEMYFRVARALCIPDDVMRDLLLRARVTSALEQRGLSPDQVEFVWTGIVHRLSERGVTLRLDVPKLLADIIEGPPCG